MKKKIPYGNSNFESLRLGGYVYVDKTRFIEVIENLNEKYVFFLRPRRFGKSLFISVLDHYYGIHAKHQFDALFSELYIHQNPTPRKNTYCVLNFDFSGIATSSEDDCLTGFREKVLQGLHRFCDRYHFDHDYPKTGTPAGILGSFLTTVQPKLPGSIYVLIDEYDHFANELLSFQTDLFKDIVSKSGFVRKFYEVLKEGTKTIIDRIFATGVSPITLDSLTSGFNIATDRTRSGPMNEAMGFTESEVRALFPLVLPNVPVDEVLPVLKENYNGYLFSETASTRIFNSDMILYYLNEYSIENAPPRNLIDDNIASDYAKIRNLFKLHQKDNGFAIMTELMGGQPQNTLITSKFSLEREFTDHDLRSLLFYMGLLTIDRPSLSVASLMIPNYVIKELYFDFFIKSISDQAHIHLKNDSLFDAIISIANQGIIDPFLKIIEDVLAQLSKRDFIQFDEKYIKLLMIAYLIQTRIYSVKSEYEVPGGYIDIALLQRNGIPVTYQALIELKYLKSSASKIQIENAMADAKNQLALYASAPEFVNRSDLKLWAVVIVGCKCYWVAYENT